MRAPAPRPAVEAQRATAQGPQNRLGKSTETSSQYPAVYSAVSMTVQGIVGAVVSSHRSSSEFRITRICKSWSPSDHVHRPASRKSLVLQRSGLALQVRHGSMTTELIFM